MTDTLTDKERLILDIAQRHYHWQANREQDIRDELEISATNFYQLLNALLDRQAALAYAPIYVNRARRRREANHRRVSEDSRLRRSSNT